MEEAVKILCVDDESNVLKALTRLFMDEDYEIFTASSGEEGLALLAEQWDIQVVISDYRMPGLSGVDFLKAVYEGWPDTIRIVLSGYADTASVVAAINEGQIYRFIGKPWNDDDLKDIIRKAIEYYGLERKNKELAQQLQDSNRELQMHNEALEKLVVDRTAELVFQNQMLRNGQTILDNLPVGVVGIDGCGFIIHGNPRFYEIVGQARGSLMGQDFSQVFPEEVVQFAERVSAGSAAQGRFAIQGKPWRINAVPVNTGDSQNWLVLAIEAAEEEPVALDAAKNPGGNHDL